MRESGPLWMVYPCTLPVDSTITTATAEMSRLHWEGFYRSHPFSNAPIYLERPFLSLMSGFPPGSCQQTVPLQCISLVGDRMSVYGGSDTG